MCLRDMIDDAKAYELDRSINARMAISKYGSPIKSVSMHRNCSTPLWKVLLVTASVMIGIAMLCCIFKKCHCEDE